MERLERVIFKGGGRKRQVQQDPKQQEVLGGWELRRGSGLAISKVTGNLRALQVGDIGGTEVRMHRRQIEREEWKL